MLRVYNALLLPLRGVTALWGAWAARDAAFSREWNERRARELPVVAPAGVWIHGASVGEARLARLIAAEIRRRDPRAPLVASCLTRTGRTQLPEPPLVDAAFFAPLDFPGWPGRVLDAVRPTALALVETELWPNLLREARRRGIRVALLNARLSPERMRRYRALRALYGPLVRGMDLIAAQSSDDARRFLALGARPDAVAVTGNIKYDQPPPKTAAPALRERFGLAPDREILVAGSTGEGEDGPVLDAFVAAREESPGLFLVLAPRHPERAGDARSEAGRRGLRLHALSSGDDRAARSADGILVDTLGELANLFPVASLAFVGGSLVPVGGHNLLEPAAAGVPVLFGPHTHHVSEIASALIRAGAALRVESAASLARVLRQLLRDPARRESMGRAALSVVRDNQGALERSVTVMLSLLERGGGERP